jgi:hypothetical protein
MQLGRMSMPIGYSRGIKVYGISLAPNAGGVCYGDVARLIDPGVYHDWSQITFATRASGWEGLTRTW